MASCGSSAAYPGMKSLVVDGGRQHIADPEVAGLQPRAPRHPGRCEQCARTRQQYHFIDGDGLRPRGADDGHGPSPVCVRPIGAGKEMGHNAVGVGLDADVVTYQRNAGDLLRSRAGHVDAAAHTASGGEL